jgi:hypothetical protein
MRLIELLIEKLPVLIFVIVAIVQVARAILKSREAQEEHEQTYDETEEGRRVREIQERLRRVVAERRRQGSDGQPPGPIELPPVLRPEPETAPEEEMPRTQTTFERTELPAPVIANREHEQRRAEIARQEALAEELRRLNDNRELARRRATHLAEAAVVSQQGETNRRATSRGQLLVDLRQPGSLRRAIVLREVLGPPVALR